jgi:hypothetical protein
MKHSSLLAIAFVLSSVGCREETTGPAGDGGPSLAAEASTQIVVNQLDLTRFNDCGNGGAGEDVHLTGPLKIVFHVTLDGSGGAHVVEVHNPQGVSGTGLTTGTMYRGVGGSPLDASNVRVGEEHTSVTNILLIGQGPGNNFVLQEHSHITVLADGTVTSFHDDFSSECR